MAQTKIGITAGEEFSVQGGWGVSPSSSFADFQKSKTSKQGPVYTACESVREFESGLLFLQNKLQVALRGLQNGPARPTTIDR